MEEPAMIDKTYLESVCAAQSLPFSPELSEKLDQYAHRRISWIVMLSCWWSGTKK